MVTLRSRAGRHPRAVYRTTAERVPSIRREERCADRSDTWPPKGRPRHQTRSPQREERTADGQPEPRASPWSVERDLPFATPSSFHSGWRVLLTKNGPARDSRCVSA